MEKIMNNKLKQYPDFYKVLIVDILKEIADATRNEIHSFNNLSEVILSRAEQLEETISKYYKD